VTTYAWWRRWPRWSAPWLGYALAVPFLFFITTVDSPLGILLAFFAWLIGCAVVFFRLSDLDRTTACLAAFSWVPVLWSLLALDEVHSRVDDPSKATLPAVWQSGFRSGTWVCHKSPILASVLQVHLGISR